MELSDSSFYSTEDSGVVIKGVDMAQPMQKQAIDVAISALSQQEVGIDAAAYIKKRFDEIYGPRWHCIVGREFAPKADHFISFYVRASKQAVLLFKAE